MNDFILLYNATTSCIATRWFPLAILHAIVRSKNSGTAEIKGKSTCIKNIIIAVNITLKTFQPLDLYQYKQLKLKSDIKL